MKGSVIMNQNPYEENLKDAKKKKVLHLNTFT